MNPKPYLLLTGCILGVVGVGHLLRILMPFTVVAGGWEVPLWISWLGSPACLLLSAWGFKLAARSR